MRWLLLGLTSFWAATSLGPLRAEQPAAMAVVRTVSQMTCRLASGPSVTLEVVYDRKRDLVQPETVATSVAALRQALKRQREITNVRDLISASWRIVNTEFSSDAFFGERTQRACSKGCALHEAQGIDVRSQAFVAAPATGADMQTDLEFSNLDAIYGVAPRAILSFIGFGDYQGFVIELPGTTKQFRTNCDWRSATPRSNN